jgi:ADP-heptose:LPS heptosyltransferase
MHQSIGDMIVFSSLIREIKSGYQNPSIQVIASKKNIDIAKQNPYIDKVFLYENKWSKLFPLLLNLRSINFHYAIELEAKVVTRVILMLKIISPQCILSVSKREGRYGLKPQDVLPYDYYTNENLNHQSDTSLDILRLINIKVTDKSYDFFLFWKT